jgi:PAS domain S-box-containing protein
MTIDSDNPLSRLGREEKFSLLVAHVVDYAIYLISPTGVISSWNSGARAFKGYDEQEVLGKHFSMFYTPEDRAAGLPERAVAAAREHGRFEGEGWRVRKDGSRFWAHVVIDRILDDEGRLIGFAKITRDITEKREAQAALQRANEALYQAQKLEAIGQLTGGVAHDFNNLLAVIVNGLDVLALQPQTPGATKVLDSMRRAAERGAALVQQLLAYARRQPLHPQTSDINRLILGFETVLRRAVPSAVGFELELEPDLPAVLLDAARFESTLLNLAVNARDAMPGGGGLKISTARATLAAGEVGALPAGGYVRVRVADTGSGMAADVAARAFEPFYTTKEIGKGTGLGLSQVYGFVTQSGGDVVLDTAPGRGTTLSLYLPAVEAEPAAAAADGAPAEPDACEQRSHDAARVLVVDDEPDVLEVTVELFRSMGYEVLTARSAGEALSLIEDGADVGLLFSDVMMPGGISGIELARRARAIAPEMRIVLASGYPLPALQQQHGALDEFTLLTKPYRLADIVRSLRAG